MATGRFKWLLWSYNSFKRGFIVFPLGWFDDRLVPIPYFYKIGRCLCGFGTCVSSYGMLLEVLGGRPKNGGSPNSLVEKKILTRRICKEFYPEDQFWCTPYSAFWLPVGRYLRYLPTSVQIYRTGTCTYLFVCFSGGSREKYLLARTGDHRWGENLELG